MKPRPDVALEVALEQRQRVLDQERQALAERDLAVQEQAALHKQRLDVARGEADTARGAVAVAHQQVRALELVLEARAAERAEKQRRAELRLADEAAARLHS